jgi:hypothetical protein
MATAPLKNMVQNHNASCRVAKWVTELMGYHITYVLRMTIKSQVLMDFIIEWTKV